MEQQTDKLFETSLTAVEALAYASVAPEQGVDASVDGLTYAVPRALADLAVGDRVIVPLGRGDKPVAGFVTALRDDPPEGAGTRYQLKAILKRDAHSLSLPGDLIELARWMAAYYCCPPGMVFATMLPAAVKRGTGRVVKMMVRAREKSPVSEQDARLSKLQRAVLEAAGQRAADGEPWTEVRELANLAGAKTTGPVRQLIDKGLLDAMPADAVHGAPLLSVAETGVDALEGRVANLELTDGQRRSLEHLAARIGEGFGVHLLHGVTGSGKTEVYLRAIEGAMGKAGPGIESGPAINFSLVGDAIDLSSLEGRRPVRGEGSDDQRLSGQEAREPTFSQPLVGGQHSAAHPHHGGAIVLVPEIALTPQTVRRFTARFGDGVAVLHSGLTAAQRHEQWRRIRAGEAAIVVGARSAIFAPVRDLRLIIVDEEHDASYKQDQLPRYHARDVAVKRGQLLNIPVLLGSATPSLESYYNTRPESGRGYHLLHLPDRVAGLKLPKVEIVDMNCERQQRGAILLLSQRLEDALRQTIAEGGQAMLLLNRRGYANYIACPDHRCGWMMGCDFCDTLMVYHKDRSLPAGGVLRCHHCGAEQILPRLCPLCGKRVSVFGLGTQRVEEQIERLLPDAALARMDGDTMRSGRDYHAALEAFRHGQVRILLGTQMIAKGLDFPNVRLVGVISADTAIHLPDFRAAERTFQLVAQVAGRAGRGEHGGLVIVQTFSPEQPAIALAARHDYPTFAEREIACRREVGLPPITRMARIVVRDRDHLKAAAHARDLAGHLGRINHDHNLGVHIRGPMPCPIARVAEHYRHELQLLAPDAGRLQRLMTTLRNARLLKSDQHTAVDVDPVMLL